MMLEKLYPYLKGILGSKKYPRAAFFLVLVIVFLVYSLLVTFVLPPEVIRLIFAMIGGWYLGGWLYQLSDFLTTKD